MINDYAQAIRRELHMYPEIGFDLDRTLSLIRRELDSIGLPYTEKYGRSSIVATLNEEKKSTFCIGIRADTDALPIQEINEVPYKSKTDGAMHACGHDAHTAILLATAKELKAQADKIDCCVKFIFQAAEEYPPSGAMLMAKDGVMDDIDTVISLHVDVNFDTGYIGLSDGNQGAISHGFELVFNGLASHVANQNKGIDAITMAVKAYTDIEFMIAKEIAAKHPVIFNIGSIHGGVANNIICDKCTMFATVRAKDEEVEKFIINRINTICNSVAASSGGTFEFVEKKYYPMVYNDERVDEAIRKTVTTVLGEGFLKAKSNTGMGGEDFSYFTKLRPGSMFRLGIRNREAGITVGGHHDNFNIDENALDIGVRMFTGFVKQNMHGELFKN